MTGNLVKVLASPDKQLQRQAAQELAVRCHLDVELRRQLIALLNAPSAEQRWGATYALATAKHPPLEVIPVLASFLGHSDSDVRWAALRLITKVAAPSVVLPHLLIAARSPAAIARRMSMYAFRDLGPTTLEVQRAVAAGIADPELEVRRAALSASSRMPFGSDDIFRAVMRAVGDPDAGSRRAAVLALRAFPDREAAVELLDRMLKHEDPATRQAALHALGRR